MIETLHFCTLFDSNYLDRAIVMYESLEKVENNFILYAFTFDNIATTLLKKLNKKNLIVIDEKEILTSKLREIKAIRGRTEYCWTCTPIIVEYVLDNYHVDSCTYIDADMCFYATPRILLDEIIKSESSVAIIEHRFHRDSTRYFREKYNGKYCVEFNTFMNDYDGRRTLQYWKTKCIEECTSDADGKTFGDQKYLDEWPDMFRNIHVIQNVGAGVAPWNLSDYRLKHVQENLIKLIYKKTMDCDLVFFHFQNFQYISDNEANIGIYYELGRFDEKLITVLYDQYCKDIRNVRHMLYVRFHYNFKTRKDDRTVKLWKYPGIRGIIANIASLTNAFFKRKCNYRKF